MQGPGRQTQCNMNIEVLRSFETFYRVYQKKRGQKLCSHKTSASNQKVHATDVWLPDFKVQGLQAGQQRSTHARPGLHTHHCSAILTST